MCRTQCVLALVALYVGLVHSWDVAVSLGDQLIFYTNGTKTNSLNFTSHHLTALAYNEVDNMILYIDKQNGNDGICGYNLLSMKSKCFIRRVGSNINSIAFEPATKTVFFTDTNERSINWMSLYGFNKNVHLLIKLNDRTPSNIAVDSCNGYIYWTNTFTETEIYMERARFNGSDIKCIYKDFPVMGMAIDPQTQKIYNFDGYSYRFLDSRNLDGENEKTLISNLRENSTIQYLYNPKELTVSNDYLYWIESNKSYGTVWYLPKDESIGVEPKEISKFQNESPLGIVANYKIKDQIKGLVNCEFLSSLIPQITRTNNSVNIQQTTEYTTVTELFCVHGIKVSETTTSICKCTPGYIGERCDVSVCENYCLQGNCSFNDEGLPICRCSTGYSGEMCEASDCYRYCLNNGTCSLNEKSEPVCQCKGDYVGDRCEVSDCQNYCIQGECNFNEEGLPTCRCNAGYSGERCEVYACHGYCLNNGDCSLNENSEPVCQCKRDYVGDRCEVSDCLNYCVQGECSFNEGGLPTCRCNAGYSGERCEVYACHGYCLNNGDCSLNEEDEPVCQCVGNHHGTRCETVKDVTINKILMYDSAKKNLTLADILLSWRKPSSKMYLTVEI